MEYVNVGLETAILAGLNVASAIGNYNAAKSESRAIAVPVKSGRRTGRTKLKNWRHDSVYLI